MIAVRALLLALGSAVAACGHGGSNAEARNTADAGASPTCKPENTACASASECCSLLCESGRCVSPAPPSASRWPDAGFTRPCLFDSNGGELCASLSCAEGADTTLTGKVYDPAGKVPLYHALVSVPHDALARLAPIVPGAPTCACSGIIDGAFTSATTDATGSFTLKNVPVGKNVPLVIQLGKWRRVVFVPEVVACVDNEVPAELSRLPRNQMEGDIPQMAILTGPCDQLGCLLANIGLDASEFTGPDAGGRVHVYRGAGPGPDLEGGGGGVAGDCSSDAGGCPLWSTRAALERYDMVLLGCECGDDDQNKPDKGPMHDWLGEGGMVLLTHYQSTWLRNGPADFRGVVTWSSAPAGSSNTLVADTSWDEGTQFARWLDTVGATDADGGLPIDPARVTTSVSATKPPTVQWLFDPSTSPGSPKLLSFETPIGGVIPTLPDGGMLVLPPAELAVLAEAGVQPTEYCGEAVVTDIHASARGAQASPPIPGGCAGEAMSPDEKALEFVIFNMSQRICELNHVPPPPPRVCTFGSSACDQCAARSCCVEVQTCAAKTACAKQLACLATCEDGGRSLADCVPEPCNFSAGPDPKLGDLLTCEVLNCPTLCNWSP